VTAEGHQDRHLCFAFEIMTGWLLEWDRADSISANCLLRSTERSARHLSWPDVAHELWAQSEDLNALRDDHPISSTTISNMASRGGISVSTPCSCCDG
jgi:hypothetical protein